MLILLPKYFNYGIIFVYFFNIITTAHVNSLPISPNIPPNFFQSNSVLLCSYSGYYDWVVVIGLLWSQIMLLIRIIVIILLIIIIVIMIIVTMVMVWRLLWLQFAATIIIIAIVVIIAVIIHYGYHGLSWIVLFIITNTYYASIINSDFKLCLLNTC